MSNENNNEEKSFIYIEFADIGSVNVTVSSFESVTAFQLLAMAHLLEFEGKGHLAVERTAQMQSQLAKQQAQQIAVPKPTIELGKK